MNKRLIFDLALRLTLLDWILFFLLFFCFDHSLGAQPPGFLELALARALQVLAFPMTLVVAWLGKDPPYFLVSVIVLYAVGALAWAVLIERSLSLFKRGSSRHARHESTNHNG